MVFLKKYFNFYGIRVSIESNSGELLDKISKDFSFFKAPNDLARIDFVFSATSGEIPWSILEGLESVSQSEKCVTYEREEVRYNDYHGSLLSCYDYKHDRCELFSPDENRLHEELYLAVLSRTGKAMDLKGLHKLHGFGIIYRGVCCVCTMPMKGGKSTLLLELLKDPEVKIMSDDTPVVAPGGRVIPFPLRIGIGAIPADFPVLNPDHTIYEIDRHQYGKKHLLSLDGFLNEVGMNYRKLVLIEGKRKHYELGEFEGRSFFQTMKDLGRHGVIGIGLPMILEYFWQKGAWDFFVKSRIFISRLFSMAVLALRSESFTFKMGTNPEQNAKDLIKLLKRLA